MIALLLLLRASTAGPVIAALLGVQAPIEAGTRSDLAPTGGLLAGFRVDAAALVLQPEVVVGASLSSESMNAAVGAAALWGDPLNIGPYAHLGFPLAGGYPVPTADAGAALEWSPSILTIGVRAGYSFIDTIHAKCGSCAQLAHHYADLTLGVGAAF